MRLTSWGNFPVMETTVQTPRDEAGAISILESAGSVIGRGLGRSYGDSALNSTLVVSAMGLNAMEDFDEETGLLVAESGVSLAEIVDAFIPRGWFLPVTPGTKFITLGGAIASDVHGKNHHESGSFARHVAWFDIWTPAQGVLRCSPGENAGLFHATMGGQGLTGFILRAALRLVRIPSAFIVQDTIKAENLAAIMELFESQASLPFSVAWIDCLQTGAKLGRSVFMGGRFAEPGELTPKNSSTPFDCPPPRALSVPVDFPSFALNSFSVRAFNALYYAKAPTGHSKGVVSYNTFFYPLDAVYAWNRIYGKRGFTQYQFVIPKEGAAEGLAKILGLIAAAGQGSFLAVLKLFGKQPVFTENISFPMEGYTLALDFPISGSLFPLLDRLDAMVVDHGGRLYLTKDARMRPDVFAKGYGEALRKFLDIKSYCDPDGIFASAQSHRLEVTR